MAGTAYIVGAYIPNGGTYMAYAVGRILHEHFGWPVTVVSTAPEQGPDNAIFHYPHVFATCSIEEMLGAAGPQDLLLCNPSFSNNGFGLRFPGRKVMYVQDFKTFSVLDRYFDHYVSVSSVVQAFLKRTYQVRSSLIPAFVLQPERAPRPWSERPANDVLVHVKGKDRLARELAARVGEAVLQAWPQARLVPLHFDTKVSQRQVLGRLGEVRTLASLVPAEGFGLTPLEAMATGTTVCGLDGIGGRDYMRPGRNCLVTRYGPVDAIARTVVDALADPARAARVAARGRRTAERYGYAAFEARWRRELAGILGATAAH